MQHTQTRAVSHGKYPLSNAQPLHLILSLLISTATLPSTQHI